MQQIVLYNLKDTVTDGQYQEYCRNKKGPFLAGLPSCKSFTLVRTTASMSGQIPYRYVGIVDITGMTDWERDTASPAFGEFFREWSGMVADFHILMGREVGMWQAEPGD